MKPLTVEGFYNVIACAKCDCVSSLNQLLVKYIHMTSNEVNNIFSLFLLSISRLLGKAMRGASDQSF